MIFLPAVSPEALGSAWIMSGERFQRNTHQKAAILNFIRARGDSHIRAEDIISGLEAMGEPVGKATVYRYLKALEGEGLIRRYTISDKVPACYQYVGDQPGCREHCHLMCVRCQKLIHVENPHIHHFFGEILEKEDFLIDPGKTVFYGLCRECRGKDESR